ncbi:hypothetical protein Vretimale_6644 [Volvox reticuliferus]|uniref:Uncharacterized protein n=1 Tax=Volvox reticuliferus TaxID=1737510 RepID=A0A8J4LML7_9CHLO|nr:hypothetical protein Vretifemale_7245 [Volvox reticuliferus]GIM01932.1 hypothetical protein Vretimale_6644 [Volvox reticuliferus]
MPPINKKQKLQHGGVTSGIPTKKSSREAGLPIEQPRFQMNSDFSDSEEDNHMHKGSGLVSIQHSHGGPNRSTPAGNGAASAPRPPASQGARPDLSSKEPLHASPASDDQGNDLVGSGGVDGSDNSDSGGDANGSDDGQPAVKFDDGTDDDGDGVVPGSGDGDQENGKKPKLRKVLTKQKLHQVNQASDRRGIVYISRIPPHMKPHKVRQLLEPFGDIGRVYCAPEDPALRRLRKKKGGNTGKNFTEGWVEFEDKRRAKRAALALNGQPMGGSKRSAYHYDLWNIKYLPKFKWDALTEEINYQRAVREQRLVAEISAAKRERDFYLSRVDKAKAIGAIKERRNSKQQQDQQQEQTSHGVGHGGGHGGGGGDDGIAEPAPPPTASELQRSGMSRSERRFGQRRVKADPVLDDQAPVLADDVLGLLGRKRRPPQLQA